MVILSRYLTNKYFMICAHHSEINVTQFFNTDLKHENNCHAN